MKRRIIIISLLVLLIAGGFIAWQLFGPVVSAPEGKYLYIRTGSTYEEVKKTLTDQKIVGNTFFFDKVAKYVKYPAAVKPGRYLVKNGMSVVNLVRMLRAGRQEPVKLVITKLRTKEDLAEKIAANFECTAPQVLALLYNNDSLRHYGLDSNTLMTAVIPNTYNMLWNSSPTKIFSRLHDEKEKFWNAERKRKAMALNLSPDEIYTMASIVEEETNAPEDKGLIASVYMNRIQKGMKLEADPTVKFAMRDFGLKRILLGHLKYPSPYNTYQNTGLPPGPICTPSINTIDAVLDQPQTDYIFFVAKPDFKGLSNFAATYAEHLVYAKAYQQALDSLIIRKRNKAIGQQ